MNYLVKKIYVNFLLFLFVYLFIVCQQQNLVSSSRARDISEQRHSGINEKPELKRRLSWNFDKESLESTSAEGTTLEEHSTLAETREMSYQSDESPMDSVISNQSSKSENATSEEKFGSNNLINNSLSISTISVQKVADSVIPTSIKSGQPVMFSNENQIRQIAKKKEKKIPPIEDNSSLNMPDSHQNLKTNVSTSEYQSEEESTTTVSNLCFCI